MDFRVLGQLEVWRDGERLALGSPKQRALLAVLLIDAGRTVSADRLIDELWGDEVAADRHNALWVQVSKLRSLLEPDREPRAEGRVLLTRVPGYVLHVDPGDVDAWRFEQLVVEARALIDTDPAVASMALGEGLELWRGRPYEDFLYDSFAQAEIARLDELRLEAVELRIDADLRRGLAAELVGELQGLVRQHPLREQITALLMVALYRSSRQAEALRAYAQLRSRLGEEVGLDPSAALQELEARILRNDPQLDAPLSSVGAPGRLVVRGYELRDEIGMSALGPTYRAFQPAVGREVIVTVVPPEVADDAAFIRRFQATAEKVARLEHPNIVPLYDFWREPGAAYLVTPHVQGTTLEDALSGGPLSAATAISIVEDVASGVAFAHRNGVAHGGLTPASVLLDDGRRARVAGFGLQPESEGGAQKNDVRALGRLLAISVGVDPDDHAAVASLPAALAAVIARATSTTDGFADATSFAETLRASDGQPDAPPSGPPSNPYKGLLAFGEVDAGDFFGRERLVERLIARLGSTGSVGRFVAVVGPSGSGKSSAVGAGLLPALRSGALPGSGEWFIAQMTPSRHPYEELAAALRTVAVDPPVDLLAVLTDGVKGIGRGVRRVLADERSQLLLVIDQFEEIFTLADPRTCRAFLDALAEAVEDRHSRVRVVITLRADFYDRPLRHRDLGELLRRGTELITVMSPEELQRAIEGPAEQVGVHFEAGLVAEMVADVADHAAALPLLQYALTELFERRRGRTIVLATYRELGGAGGALVHRAEDVYRELDVDSRETTRQVMLRLVNVGDGDSDEVTRRRVLRQELLGLGDARVADVLDTLGRHRLLAFDRDAATRSPTVEIAHEALFVEWDRLRGWIADCRLDVRRHRRLATGAEEWRASSQAVDYVLRGARLDEAVSFAATSEIRITPAERAFIDASLAQREVERKLEQAQRERERRLRKRGRRRTLMLGSSAVILAVVTALSVIAIVRRRESDRMDVAREEASRLAAASTEVGQDDPELGMLLALQSLTTSADAGVDAAVEAAEALQWGIQAAGLTYPFADAAADVRQGPNGPTGIFAVPLAETVDLARAHLTRGFTPDECATYSLDPCPSRGLASPVETGPAKMPDSVTPVAPADRDRPLAGTTVTVLDSVWGRAGLAGEFQAFEERTGISVRYIRQDGDTTIDTLADGASPDITLWPAPGGLIELAEEGRLVDLATYIDHSALRRWVGDGFVDTATVGSGLYGVPLYLDLKGLVWYPVHAFEQAGYAIPRTWDELIALSHRMVAEGRTPWCFGMETGVNTGWIVTDWMEALVLRIGGPELYDRWIRHEVPFDHPAVRQAGAMLDEVFATPGFVEGGPAGAVRRDPLVAFAPIGDDPPGCWMSLGVNLDAEHLPNSAILGEDVDYFMLPPTDAGMEPPVLLGGFMAAALSDRPEVRELMRHMASHRSGWGRVGGGLSTGSFIPVRADLGGTDCHSSSEITEANVVRLRYCQEVRDALASGDWRIDGSDLMPSEMGGPIATGTDPAAFPEGMTTYFEQGAEGMDEILAEIEEAWP
jgi:DNA-binding SARP family transcriptional activator